MVAGLRTRLADRLDNVEGLRDGPRWSRLLADGAEDALWSLCGRALFLEWRCEIELGTVPPPERPDSAEAFAELTRRDGWIDTFFATYPVLPGRVETLLDDWVDEAVEFCGRLVGDRRAVADVLGFDVDRTDRVRSRAGDPHRRGRAVRILGAGDRRVVYRPRSCSAFTTFNALLDEVHERLDLSSPSLRTVNRGGYGWVEHVRPGRPADPGEFYRRAGVLLAVAWALRLTDLHFENIIASERGPVAFDVETLLQPALDGRTSDPGDFDHVASPALNDSVLLTGLVPRVFDLDLAPVDPAALTAMPGMAVPGAALGVDTTTGSMRLAWEAVHLDSDEHLPFPAAEAAPSRIDVDAVLDGFQAAADTICALGADALPESADATEIRLVLRPTAHYLPALTDATHPDALTSPRRQHAALRRRLDVDAAHPPVVVDAEVEQLAVGDVPWFSTVGDSGVVRTGAGATIRSPCALRPVEDARKRLDELRREDVRRQKRLLAVHLRPGTADGRLLDAADLPDRRGSRLEVAAALADELMATRLDVRPGGTWHGVRASDHHWTYADIGDALYDGRAGVALALALAGAALGRADVADAGLEVAAAVVARARRVLDASHRAGGAFEGPGSVLYLLATLEARWPGFAGANGATALVATLAERSARDADATQVDVIGGDAGLVLSALCLREVVGDLGGAVGRLVDACAARLLRTAHRGTAWTWPSPLAAGEPFLGFAHGSVGILEALLRAADHGVEVPVARLARQQQLHAREIAARGGRRNPDSWCHGVCGLPVRVLAEPTVARSAARSLDAVTPRSDPSLCHGIGSLIALGGGARPIDGAAVVELARRRVTEHADVPVAPVGPASAPGLMTGLGGVLLLLADPDAAARLLRLEPPPAPAGRG